MDHAQAKSRFRFLAEAVAGSGGFAPVVTWEDQPVSVPTANGGSVTAYRRVPLMSGPCHLVPYQRESAEKLAGRAAIAVYENHLEEAVGRFTGYLGRKSPMRTGIDSPQAALLVEDADMRGTPLDVFWIDFAAKAKARGSMFLLIEMPADDAPSSLWEQIARRAVPYLRAIEPENVKSVEIDPESGRVVRFVLQVVESIDGQPTACDLTYTDDGWTLDVKGRIIDASPHPFGVCPVLAFTETGGAYPVIGKYAQIADLSRRHYNARSELDEILRGQTFSLLALQIPADERPSFDAAQTAATIGTHSMLIHSGSTPAFVAPDSGPADVYLRVIEQLESSIKRIAQDDATTGAAGAESGVARKMRFERLNADLAHFSRQMQALERRMWALFARAMGIKERMRVEWPSDFNLVDTLAEIDILTAMQGAGFPDRALVAKRQAIAGSEFDSADDDTKAEITAAINEAAQAAPPAPQPIGAA